MDQLPGENYPWHVHQYPFPSGQESPCSPSNVGGHFDPFGAIQNPIYASDCPANKSLCEVGDLSGKFGDLTSSNSSVNLTDVYLDLHGRHSVVGRSVVLHFNNGSRYVCANIGFPENGEDEVITTYVPLRGSRIVGDILIFQYLSNATYVYSRLSSTPPTSLNHNWHVHNNPVSVGDSSCSSAGAHYNPRLVDVSSSNYSVLCHGETPLGCEVGDLSGKAGTLDFNGGLGRLLYTDTDLPYTPRQENNNISIANRSIVVHEAGAGPQRIACGNIIRTSERQANATFSGEKGINGVIRFRQMSPFTATEVEINLSGLSESVSEYYIYEAPVGESKGEMCSSKYTGSPWNLPIGDLSDKFGPLSGDVYNNTFTDSNVPLFGRNSVIGRSIILHHKNESRWVCANIVYDMPTVEANALFNVSGHMVMFSFIQPADNAFVDTTITVKTVIEAGQSDVSSPSFVSTSTVPTSFFTSTATPFITTTTTSTTTTSSSVKQSTSSSTSSTSASVVSSTTAFLTSPIISSSPNALLSSMFSPPASSPRMFLPPSPMTSAQISSPSPSPFPSIDGSGDFEMTRKRRNIDSDGNTKDGEMILSDEELLFFDDFSRDDDAALSFKSQRSQRSIHKRETVSIGWSVKKKNGGQQVTTNCDSLEEFLMPVVDRSASTYVCGYFFCLLVRDTRKIMCMVIIVCFFTNVACLCVYLASSWPAQLVLSHRNME